MLAAAESHTPLMSSVRRRLVVEVARAVVGRSAVGAAVFEQVHERERVVQVAVAEHQVLVVLDAALAVEVDVEELAVVQRLGDAGGEVEARHLLVADLGVEADELGALERVDERERVTERWAAGCRRGARWAWARWRSGCRSPCR